MTCFTFGQTQHDYIIIITYNRQHTGSKWKVAIVNSCYDPVSMLGIMRFYYNVSIV